MATLVADAGLLVEVILRRPFGPATISTIRAERLAAPAHVDAEVVDALIGLVRAGIPVTVVS